MTVRALTSLLIMAATLVMSGCTASHSAPEEMYTPDPNPRTHWELRHRVVDASGLQVIGQHLAHREESTTVAVAASGITPADECSVLVSEPGVGGPDNKVGDKISTTFDGHPAVRNGAGAEGDYLVWQLDDGSWAEVSCSALGSRATIDRVAAAVAFEPTTIRIPVDVELPSGYRPASVDVDLSAPGSRVYLERTEPTSGPSDLLIMVGVRELSPQPTGEPRRIGGRPALVHSDDVGAVVWVQQQDRWVYVGTVPSDTGPYPDRSNEIPVLEEIAESVSFPEDLAVPGTWFSAENVFG
ncbi:MAG TPA: hypothetical protein VEX66_11055 [Microlunatus sp.]|nr:hypothetical protein [Microlunatus sp.]